MASPISQALVSASQNKKVQLDSSSNKSNDKKKKKILDEEIYTENIERIVVRDFFPDHQHLKDQKEYLEAEERKDFEKMRQIALRYATVGPRGNTPLKYTPMPSPATFETPLHESRHPGTDINHRTKSPNNDGQTSNDPSNFGYNKTETPDVEVVEEVKEKDKHIGLDKFLSKYTSEDNDSYEFIIERSEQAKREKHAWLYEAEERHAEATKEILQLEDNKTLAITDGSTQSDGSEETNSVAKAKTNSRATVPIHTWDYKVENTLMFYPDGLEKTDDEIFKKPLLIKHENTRFKDDPFKDGLVRTKLSQKMNESKSTAGEKIGHDGKSVIPQESPRVGGYGFVATPSPMPGVDESPLMTWGEVDSTPLRLETTATPGPAFRFPEESERDRLTHKMVDENTKKNRAKKEKALKQMKASVLGTPNRMGSIMSSERINLLSPAAKRLVNKRFSMGTDKALKASYTPTPSRRSRVGGETPIVKTPSSRLRKTPKNTPTPSRDDITDNLLNIPGKKRKTASDFF